MSELARKLSEEELFQCFKSLNVPVRLSDIKTPTRDFIIKVMECFLKDIQIDIRALGSGSFEVLNHLENPEISEDARMLLLLTTCVNYFIRPDGPTLQLKDITVPKPKRTKMILNYLIIFWNYVLTKIALFESIADGFRDEIEKIDNLLRENEYLSEKYNEGLVELKNLQPKKEELSRCISIKNERLQAFASQKEASDNEYKELKKKERDSKSQAVTVDVNIIAVQEAISELDQCILTSPERFTDDINKLKGLIKQEELKMKDKESELKEKLKKFDTFQLSQKDKIKVGELLQKIKESYSELSNTAHQLVLETQKAKQQEDEMKNLEEEISRKREKKNLYEEKSYKVQLNTKLHIDTVVTTVQTLQKDVCKEQELLENAETATSELVQKIDKAADDVLEAVELCNQAEAESVKAHAVYSAQMEAVTNNFREDCLELKEKVKLFFEL